MTRAVVPFPALSVWVSTSFCLRNTVCGRGRGGVAGRDNSTHLLRDIMRNKQQQGQISNLFGRVCSDFIGVLAMSSSVLMQPPTLLPPGWSWLTPKLFVLGNIAFLYPFYFNSLWSTLINLISLIVFYLETFIASTSPDMAYSQYGTLISLQNLDPNKRMSYVSEKGNWCGSEKLKWSYTLNSKCSIFRLWCVLTNSLKVDFLIMCFYLNGNWNHLSCVEPTLN